jgi:serine/threonine protein kinase
MLAINQDFDHVFESLFPGWCYEKGELLLIYEYKPNGSLDHHLFPNKEHQGRILGWTTRYGISVDVAAGLHYVYREHEHMVLQRDIKASNIMLDSTFHGRHQSQQHLHECHHHWEETSSSDALAASAIIRRKARAESVDLYCL